MAIIVYNLRGEGQRVPDSLADEILALFQVFLKLVS